MGFTRRNFLKKVGASALVSGGAARSEPERDKPAVAEKILREKRTYVPVAGFAATEGRLPHEVKYAEVFKKT